MPHASTLKESLETLHGLLQDPDVPLDPGTEAELREVLDDIQRVLGEHEEDPTGLRDRVERQAVEFESRHRLLSDALNRVAQTLANMGI